MLSFREIGGCFVTMREGPTSGSIASTIQSMPICSQFGSVNASSDMPKWNAISDAFLHDVHFALRGNAGGWGSPRWSLPRSRSASARTRRFSDSRSPALSGTGTDRRRGACRALSYAPAGSTDYQTTQPYVVRNVLREQVSDFADVAVAEPTGVVRRNTIRWDEASRQRASQVRSSARTSSQCSACTPQSDASSLMKRSRKPLRRRSR